MSNHGRSKSSLYTAAPILHACPICGQPRLIRIRRRFIDHILSVFVRQRRFRCTHPGCQWQGNLREKSTRKHSAGKNKHFLQQPD